MVAPAVWPSTTSSCRPRPAARRPACWSAFGPPAPAAIVHGVAVTPADELRAAVEGLVTALGEVPGLASVPAADILIDDTQLGEGYGRRTGAADEATRLLARTEGILVDPIYTAKALAGLVAQVREGRLDGRRVVVLARRWHARPVRAARRLRPAVRRRT